MKLRNSHALAAAALAALWLGTVSSDAEQAPATGSGQPTAQRGGGGGRGGGRGAVATSVFTAADINKDGAVTRDELKTTFDKWYADSDSARAGSVTQEQLMTGLTAGLPQPAPAASHRRNRLRPIAAGGAPSRSRYVPAICRR